MRDRELRLGGRASLAERGPGEWSHQPYWPRAANRASRSSQGQAASEPAIAVSAFLEPWQLPLPLRGRLE